MSESVGRPLSGPQAVPFEIHYRATIIVFADVAEYDRLLQRDELVAAHRIYSFLLECEHELVPRCGGRSLQRVGDGLLLEFEQARDAIACAHALHARAASISQGLVEDDVVRLRIGVFSGDVLTDDTSYIGRGVNLAERLSKIGQPGQTVVSAAVRDRIAAGLDGDIEDLGDCYIKHGTTIRAYRVWPGGPHPRPGGPSTPQDRASFKPTVAIIPFSARTAEPNDAVVGEILADELIANLSRTPEIRVISRLSTSPLRDRELTTHDVATHLGANFVLTGAYRVSSDQLLLNVELADTRTSEVVWAKTLKERIQAILAGEDELTGRVVDGITSAIVEKEIERVNSFALPSLDAYTLIFAGIGLMHRTRHVDFDKARQVFEHLIERFPRNAGAYALLAEWHVFKVTQGWFSDLGDEALHARTYVSRALDCNPADPLALTVNGLVHTNLVRNLDVAWSSYEQAISLNPSEALALLHRGVLAAFQDRAQEAVHDTELALGLSPLDPWKYYYDSLSATAALSACRYERVLDLAFRSLRANRAHASTLRAIAIASIELGMEQDARESVEALLKLDPDLTVSSWLARTPSAPYETGKRWAASLRRAGLPP